MSFVIKYIIFTCINMFDVCVARATILNTYILNLLKSEVLLGKICATIFRLQSRMLQKKQSCDVSLSNHMAK